MKKKLNRPLHIDSRPRPRPVAALLKALGSNSKAIYMSLRRLGIAGRRCDGYLCPIANYLHTHHYSYTVAALPAGMYESRTGEIIGWGSNAISDFINDFDAGYYPELECRSTDRRQ